MPRGDGTGPMGMGPMTGRAAGFCAGFGVPGYVNQIPGRGFGMGFGRGAGGGFGWRNRRYAAGMTGWQRAAGAVPQMSRDQEIEVLKNQANSLQDALEAVRNQLQELEAGNKR
ncbi:MAG: DUF5320 domain-containing protein [Victivallaceae bacterium]|nr:DUF5320 domain-containing protein [Victivallaceae bacterium]